MTTPKYYLTTPIFYPNGAPHIGHAYTALASDALARFQRLDGKDVYFLTGTDEHGLKMQQTAEKGGITPQELADKNSAVFRELMVALNASPDDFIRTTEERHHRSSEEIWRRMEANGDIYLDKYSGWYSVRQEQFFDEKETTVGTDGVRREPLGSPVEWVEEESYFFRLSSYQDRLLAHYAAHPEFIGPDERRNEVASFVKGGLKDLSISRTTFDWGIHVPGNDKHVMYVWVDALTNYITGVGFPDEKAPLWRYWPADLHVIGKDIVRFHAVYWPAFLWSAGLELPKRVFAHGFLFNRGEKMSKSVGNVVDPFEMIKVYGLDQVRYFFLREVPFGQDGSYSHEAIVNRINADLANDLGNLAQRSLSMIAQELRRRAAGGQGADGRGRGDARAGRRAARDLPGGNEDAADPSGAERGLGGRRRGEPLFRRRGAVGAAQDRSGAHGGGPVCDGGNHPSGRHSGTAGHADGLGQAARPASGRSRRAELCRAGTGRAACPGNRASGSSSRLPALC